MLSDTVFFKQVLQANYTLLSLLNFIVFKLNLHLKNKVLSFLSLGHEKAIFLIEVGQNLFEGFFLKNEVRISVQELSSPQFLH